MTKVGYEVSATDSYSIFFVDVCLRIFTSTEIFTRVRVLGDRSTCIIPI
ncbi:MULTISPECIES: hypothetical protein [Okeania]|nr:MULTISPECIES: hypothetical protein [Okeania]NET12214.1 hypothetical protein [Okeania sp. SIO1H6]NEP74330.1 hypothetical protein [Okeania sp. SIO2G5]NEP95406.1 hypothetical protein [Okeania sp. SIO2F5]NES91472.1 hypothetical protein [Okeania sp. SIO2B9]NET18858.1 hypothetical protein [Okeania sp. SIO1H5]